MLFNNKNIYFTIKIEMNNQYWLKKKLHITLLLILISNTILAQYNFKLSGTFTDVKNGTLICEYIIRGQKQK